MPSIFGYWTLKGLGQAPRLLLEHVGEKYTDERLDASTDSEKWQTVKKENRHGFAFPNLPYYVDGEVKLTQSAAIMRYLARKHGLAGNSEHETQQLEMLEGVLMDLRIHFAITCYSPDEATFNKNKDTFRPMMINNLTLLNKYLGSKKFALGERITYIDFFVYDICCNYTDFDASILEGLENLKGLMKRVEALPNIARYMKSDRFVKWPLALPTAFWGGK